MACMSAWRLQEWRVKRSRKKCGLTISAMMIMMMMMMAWVGIGAIRTGATGEKDTFSHTFQKGALLRGGANEHLRPRSPFACVHFSRSRGSRVGKNGLENKGRSLCEHPWVALCLSKASAVVKKTDSCSFVNTIVRNDPCYLFARCHGYR